MLTALAALALSACANVPAKVDGERFAPCGASLISVRTGSLPYAKTADSSCVQTILPFDLSVWREAPNNSRKVRGLPTVTLGCLPLTAEAGDGGYAALGHSNTMLMNFDVTAYPDDALVRKAVLAVYAMSGAEKLAAAQFRARLHVGDELQSVGARREMPQIDQNGAGWVMVDVTSFVARAINERRNSIHFEISLPCRTPADNLAEAAVVKREPRLLVEYN
jgi:hypothetical protein